jgi:hypothetical protein
VESDVPSKMQLLAPAYATIDVPLKEVNVTVGVVLI